MARATFENLDAIRSALEDLPEPDTQAIEAAERRSGQLTKPPGALGQLERLAVWYAGWRGDPAPLIERPQIAVFAGNHGVAARGVSAYPSEVTAQMVANFSAGGAAINQLARSVGAALHVHAMDLEEPTVDFTEAPAMDEAGFCRAFATGWNAVDPNADLFVAGEMGIANTSSAAAIAAALDGGSAQAWVGRGSGVEGEALDAKVVVVAEGLARHAAVLDDPITVLRCLGGREIAAMAGAILRARHLRIPVILDGFICTAAAAALQAERHGALDHCLAGHLSVEAGHARLLEGLGLVPLLSFDMRLGEGTGAALAIPVLKAALACHSGMATFEEAGVSTSHAT